MSYIKPQNAIIDNELLRSPTENAVYDALALKQDAGNYITQLTGEVTASGPGVASATISNNAITNAKMALMINGTIKGNNSGIPAAPSDLTGTQVTALLDVFQPDTGSGGLKGLVPAPTAADSTRYLRGDGTWDTISVPASANPYLSNLLSPTAINQVLLGLDGSASAPAYSFTSDSNTGIYRSGSDTLNFATNGINRLEIESGGSVKLMSASGADILWNTDGSGNIGASGASRPDSIYIKTALNLNSLAASAILGSDASKNVVSLDASTATSYLNNFVGDGGSGGIKGLVPAPAAGDAAANKYLKADGTWSTVSAGLINPMTTIGDIIVGGVAGAATRLGLGAVDKVLVSDGTTISYQYAGLGGGALGTGNVILGRAKPVNIGTNTVLIGTDAVSTLNNNAIAIGKSARSDGPDSVAIGYNARAIDQGGGIAYNVAIGSGAYALQGQGVAVGYNTQAYQNGIAIGYQAQVNAIGGGVAIGLNAIIAGGGNGTQSVAIGATARTGSGTRNIVIGDSSGNSSATASGSNNTVVGASSFNSASLTAAHSNVIVGQGSGTNLTTGYESVIVGQATATAATTAFRNSVVGQNAALQLTTGSENTVLGYYAGSTNAASGITTGSQNVCLGARAGLASGTDSNATAVGFSSKASNYAVGIGYRCFESSNYGTSVGAGCSGVSTTNTYTVRIGYAVGNTDNPFGSYMGPIGGARSVFIGALTNGTRLATAYTDNNDCIFIGYSAGSRSQSTSNELFIDNQDRGSYVNQQTKSIIYGVMNATETSQTLRINAQARLSFGLQIAAKTGATKVTANTSINLYDHYIGVDTATPAAAVTVTLPTAATAGAGKLFIIKDEGGSALTYNIIIARSGSDKIEGSASNLTLANNREAAYLVSDGVDNWNRI